VTAAVEGEVIAKIHAYQSGGHQAATLYVRSIPVLTFLGSHSVTADGIKMGEAGERQKMASHNQASQNTATRRQQSRASEANNVENDPVWRATAVAARLNQLSRDNVAAEAIAVRWNAECNCYSIKVNDQDLVQINEKTILPDTTQNLAEDALQATNRLRRLMGNAPPLREIAGRPPVRRVAQVSLGSIRVQITGMASWYGPGFHGNRSASGEVYNQNALTAAHRSLPFGTKVQVTNLDNGRSVVVRINDRGPYVRGRVIDLSAAAARMLGVMQTGVAPVQIDVLGNQQRLATEN
jgi:rare lipoprotein A